MLQIREMCIRDRPKNTIIENCKKVPKSNTIVVLLHDSAVKNTTVEALPEIIAYSKSMGYSFGVLRDKTYPVHQKAVSYTHLDVYKRQIQNNVLS